MASPYKTVAMLLAMVLTSASFARAENHGTAQKASPQVYENLAKGIPQGLIVLYDSAEIDVDADNQRRQAMLPHDDDRILTYKSTRYLALKRQINADDRPGEMETIEDYSHLPMSFKRFNSRTALDRFLARPEVLAVYENHSIYPHLTYSLPFVNQPAVAGMEMTGSGTTVAVIDTGINYTLTAFGSCTNPGTPAGCKVVTSVDVTGNNVILNNDPNGHGTNVAGIIAGVASGTRIAAVNAFSGGASSTNWVISGINWAIANKSAYNISTINMSLGDGGNYTTPCHSHSSNPFLQPLNSARSAGIIAVASSGNSALTSGMSSPACTPNVVSVGAVYDANWSGPYTWSSGCTDSATAPDKIPCFSNSTSFLTLLAPGAFITSAGIQMAGTSQAAPHVSGGVAVLRAAFPADTLEQTVARMTGNGTPIADPRNGITTPRLNLLAALGLPGNDNFVDRQTLIGSSGQVSGNNANGTKEAGEPTHAGNAGGKSVWLQWTAPTTGMVTVDTHGTNFNTLLGIYTGISVSSLTQVAANDNDGSSGNTSGVSFTAQSGTNYLIAVDGLNGAFGNIVLNWNLVQQADLDVSLTADQGELTSGETLTYTVTVTNNGPSTAGNVSLTDVLPVTATLISSPIACTLISGTLNCPIGTLTSGATSINQIAVSASQAGAFTNTVSVSSDIADPFPANNTTSSTVTVLPVVSVAAVPALSPWGIFSTAGLILLLTKRRKP